MIALDIYFEKFGLIVLLCLFGINSAWILYCLKTDRDKFILFPSIFLVITCAIITIICIKPSWDESEHLHCSWLVSKGMVPYRDFWQHHLPMLWIFLAPLIRNLKPSFEVYVISRDLCAVFFIIISLMGWKISQMVWKGKEKLSIYLLLIFSGGITWDFFYIRPDLFMMFFLLFGIYCLLKMAEEKVLFSLLTGIMISLALSFSNKQLFFLILPLIVISLGQKKSIVLKLVLYLAGLIIGFLPLALYLFKNGIVKEFIDWVLLFNSKYIAISANFSFIIGVIGVVGWYLLSKKYRSSRDLKSLILLIAFFLSFLGSLLRVHGVKYFYYSNFWLILCAVLGSGCDINALLGRLPFRKIVKSLILGMVLALLIMSVIAPLKRFEFTFWGKDRKVISRLIDLCKNETCFVFLPYHPICAYDATRLYGQWQVRFMELQKDNQVKEDIIKKDIVENIIASPPAIISFYCNRFDRDFNRPGSKEIFNSLQVNGLISQDGYEKIKEFIEERYAIKEIDGVKFYIRNDKVGKYEWSPELPENESEK